MPSPLLRKQILSHEICIRCGMPPCSPFPAAYKKGVPSPRLFTQTGFGGPAHSTRTTKETVEERDKYHCLQIKTMKHMGGGVKLLLEAGKCDYKYNIKQIQNILHWANSQTSLINYKRRHSNYMIENEHSCSWECAPMLPATSGGGVLTPSFTAKEACTDSNHHLYQPEKIETEGNPIKYMACSLF